MPKMVVFVMVGRFDYVLAVLAKLGNMSLRELAELRKEGN